MAVNNSNSKNKKEPEDILAEVDKVVAPRKKTSRSSSVQPLPDRQTSSPSLPAHRSSFIIGGVIAIIVFAGIAGFLMLSQKPEADNTIKTNANANVNSVKINGNGNINSSANANLAGNSNSAASGSASKITNDTDSDGLINEDEAKAGTDSKNPDTDGDNLSDREEVKVWKTNPLKADTDGDGYNDGEEIKTLNDPKVPGGKLLDLNRAIQQLNTNK